MGVLSKFKSFFISDSAAKSSFEGKNTTFDSEKVVEDIHKSKNSERRQKARLNAKPGTKILIIEDSRTVSVMLRKMLQQNDYKVAEAISAERGLEIAINQRPSLIFLDLVLPGMDGFAALRNLRKDPRTKDIPVIMMSGNHKAIEIFYAHRIGADDFMKKPFSRYEVFFRIEKLFDENLILRRVS